MKTAHQFARELLAGPDMPVFHFDPSRAGMDDERDTACETPKIERVNPRAGMSKVEIRDALEEGYTLKPFLTIVADREATSDDEPGDYYEALHDILEAAGMVTPLEVRELRTIAKALDGARLLKRGETRRKGDLHWDFKFGQFVTLANPIYIGKPVPAGEVWARRYTKGR